jgi:tripartite-type tricarboxylate transporter receptor subunit TctC
MPHTRSKYSPTPNYLQQKIGGVLRQPNTKEKFAASGTDAIGNTPQEFAKMINRELEQNKKVIQAVGMRAD